MRGLLVERAGDKTLVNLSRVSVHKVGKEIRIFENPEFDSSIITIKPGDGSTFKIGNMEDLLNEIIGR